jgi:tRNA U34 5-methylaminomethyl-2-thiouridine-forming methyltransferase MnmC
MTYSQLTEDGSITLFSEKFNETYHSRKGALTESLHVFIETGFEYKSLEKKEIKIGEIGLGTGLNAILSLEFAQKSGLSIDYCSLEAFPISSQLKLEILEKYPKDFVSEYQKILNLEAGKREQLNQFFAFSWFNRSWPDFNPFSDLDVVFYDAFAPDTQPEMWDEIALNQVFKSLNEGGILVTYCAKGYVKRNLKKVGFQVESLPGPPGKREMTRATKKFI